MGVCACLSAANVRLCESAGHYFLTRLISVSLLSLSPSADCEVCLSVSVLVSVSVSVSVCLYVCAPTITATTQIGFAVCFLPQFLVNVLLAIPG